MLQLTNSNKFSGLALFISFYYIGRGFGERKQTAILESNIRTLIFAVEVLSNGVAKLEESNESTRSKNSKS